jgi:hypothetical protein
MVPISKKRQKSWQGKTRQLVQAQWNRPDGQAQVKWGQSRTDGMVWVTVKQARGDGLELVGAQRDERRVQQRNERAAARCRGRVALEVEMGKGISHTDA